MRSRSLLNLASLLFGFASAASGLTLQVRYHLRHEARIAAAGWDYTTWSLLHKLTSVVLLALIVLHVFVNWKWLRTTWTKGLFHKHRQLVTLSFLFLTAAITGMGAWALGFLNFEQSKERLIVEFHDKITLVLTLLLVLHVWSRRRRLVR